MGKATITANLGNGQYTITINQDRDKADKQIDQLNRWIAYTEQKIFDLYNNDPDHKRDGYKLGLESLKKQLSYYTKIPADYSVSAWCVDYSLNLSGQVGTIEINGDYTKTILIKPGYRTGAVPDAGDGVQMHMWAQTAEQWFYNEAMRPGWQKWMPTYRLGTITAKTHSLCNVDLDIARTAIVNFGETRTINKFDSLIGVPIEYMDCDGSVFFPGDRVVVEFGAQNNDYPKVIGFVSNPKSTALPFLAYQSYKNGDDYFLGVYDWNGNRIYTYDMNTICGTPSDWPIAVLGASEEANAVYVLSGRMAWNPLASKEEPQAALLTVPITYEYPGNDIYEIGFTNHADDPFGDDLEEMETRVGIGPDGFIMIASGTEMSNSEYTRHLGTRLMGMFCDTWVGFSNLNAMTVINRSDSPGEREWYVDPAHPDDSYQTLRCGYPPEYYTPEDHPCTFPPEFSYHYVSVRAVGFRGRVVYAAITAGYDRPADDQTAPLPYTIDNEGYSYLVTLESPVYPNPGIWPWSPFELSNPLSQYNTCPWFFTDADAERYFGDHIITDFLRTINFYHIRLLKQIISVPGDQPDDLGERNTLCLIYSFQVERCNSGGYAYAGGTISGSFSAGEFVFYQERWLFACCPEGSSSVSYYDSFDWHLSGTIPLTGTSNPMSDVRNFAITNIPSECAVLDMVNALRQSNGVSLYPGTLSRGLSRVAQAHVDWLISTGRAQHASANGDLPEDRGKAAGFFSASEVLASKTRGRTGRMYDEWATCMAGWESSPGHLATLVYPILRQVGVAWGTYPASLTQIIHGPGNYDPITHEYSTDEMLQELSEEERGNTMVFVIMVNYA